MATRSCPGSGNEVHGSAPGGLYPCSPGGLNDYCYIFAGRTQKHWRGLTRIIGREDLFEDPRLQDGAARYQHKDLIDEAVSAWTSQHPKDYVMKALADAGVPSGAVFNTLEIMHDQDLHARGIMNRIDHPERGEMTVSGWPLKMSDSFVPVEPPPLHGADNETIYGEWLGYSQDDVKELRTRQVI